MEAQITLTSLYEAIISDCMKLIEKNVEDNCVKDIRETIGSDINKLISFYRNMIQNSEIKGSVRNFALEYLDKMLSDIEGKKSDEIAEGEIYMAYGYLFSFCYINKLCGIDEIIKFELENYPNFSEIIKKKYDNIGLLKENYEKNAKLNFGGNIDKKNIKKLFHLLNSKSLIPKKTNIKKQKYGKKYKKASQKLSEENTSKNSITKIDQNKEDKKEQNEIIKFPEKESGLNIKEDFETKKDNIYLSIKPDDKKMNEINKNNNKEFDNIINNEKNINNNKIRKKSNIDSNNMRQESNTEANSEKEVSNGNTSDDNNTKIANSESNVNNIIKYEAFNNNKKETNDKRKEEIITNKIAEISDEKLDHDQLVKIVLSIQKELDNTKTELDNTKAKLDNTKTELDNTKAKLDNTKTELDNTKDELSTRINKLENNQKLMYYQTLMYQTRDIAKSIYYFFSKHLKISHESKPFFDLKNIMEYLNKNEGNYSEEDKKILRKFFKSLFFTNKVNNKILHRNLSTRVQEAINEVANKDDLLPLIPVSCYAQLFDSLSFYIENNMKDHQVQEVMKYVYINDYISDDELGKIKDDKEEAIRLENGYVKMLITKEEINNVKEIFSKIDGFALDCDLKTWDD